MSAGSEEDTSLLLDSSLLAHLPKELQEEVSANASEKKRLMEKIAKIKKKLAKVQTAKKKLNRQKKVEAGDEGAKREAWEEQLLKEAEGNEEAPLSATGRKIEQLQGEHRKLQIRTKTIEGMMKPFQKNFNTAMEENKELREKFANVDARIKAQEATNKEMLQRKVDAGKRAKDLKLEKSDRSHVRVMPASQGQAGFSRALKGILEVLELHEVDRKLTEDIRKMGTEMIGEDSGDSFHNSMASIGTPTGHKSRRRTLQGSLSSDLVSPTLSASSHS
jgi:chromosome segregation ATPase